MRSTKRQPASLRLPKAFFRHSTAVRLQPLRMVVRRFHPSTLAKVHNAGSTANKLGKTSRLFVSAQPQPLSTACGVLAARGPFACATLSGPVRHPGSCAPLKQRSDHRQAATADDHGRSSPVHALLGIPLQVGPAQLSAPTAIRWYAPSGHCTRSRGSSRPTAPSARDAAPGMDHEEREPPPWRRPTTSTCGRLLPTRFVGVFDLRFPDGTGGFRMRGGRTLAHFLFQVRHGPRATVAPKTWSAISSVPRRLTWWQAVKYDKTARNADRRRAPRMSAGITGPSDFATAGTGAGVALVLGDLGREFRQFGDLVPGRLRVVGRAVRRQRRWTASTGGRHQRDGVPHEKWTGVKVYSACSYSAGATYPSDELPALVIVEHLNVLEDRRTRLRPSGEVRPVDQLLLQGGKKALHRGIIPAVRSPAHAARDPVPRQQPLVVLAGVLAAPVGMGQQALPRQAPPHRHLQGIDTRRLSV